MDLSIVISLVTFAVTLSAYIVTIRVLLNTMNEQFKEFKSEISEERKVDRAEFYNFKKEVNDKFAFVERRMTRHEIALNEIRIVLRERWGRRVVSGAERTDEDVSPAAAGF